MLFRKDVRGFLPELMQGIYDDRGKYKRLLLEAKQEYENTKDIVDIIAYAVSDEGDLLWETYLHEGIWDIGTSITQLSDGGYIIYGLFDAVNWGGCCYNQKAGVRDLIKLNNQGQEQWRRKLNFDDNTSLSWPPATYIGKSLIQTSISDLVVIAPGLDNIINVVMMDTSGNLIWTKNLPDIIFSFMQFH